MKIIGLTGEVGSGKSTVGKLMEKHFSVRLLMADEIGHLCMAKDSTAYQEIVHMFGTDILMPEGSIDRKRLGNIVFSHKEKLEQLNQIVHPWVKNYILAEIEHEKREKRVEYIVIESAILVEAGYTDICDECWYVYTAREIRQERLKMSRGYSDEKIEKILNNQMSSQKFLEKCTKTIENNGDIEEIRRKLEVLLVS